MRRPLIADNPVLPQGPVLPGGYAYLGFEELGSTSDYARDNAAALFEEHGGPVWIHAEVQTSGRGRRGREWVSRKGNFSATLLMRPNCEPQKGAQLSFVAAMALCDALAFFSSSLRVELKWPNDVLLEGKKVSGILLESAAASSGNLDWISIGCGVNLAFHPTDMPFPATSLRAAGLEPPTPAAFLERLAAAFDTRLKTWRAEGFGPIRKAWLGLAKGQGDMLEARLAKETFRGVFTDLDETGALVLRLQDGTTRRVTAGEVFFV